MLKQINKNLISKYNIPGPRYTSYPTVPYWDVEKQENEVFTDILRCFYTENKDEGISIYMHLPFCESLCTYCGCNTRITKNHSVETPYIDALLKEWQMYLSVLNEKPVLRELHLGGGTPTFFSPENLKDLLSQILDSCIIPETYSFSFEGHPNNTIKDHLQTLYDLGFKRVSFGIQDLDPKVQKIINRIQPIENVERVVEQAREIGYESINFDLIYGLPLQTKESVKNTIEQVIKLMPDRIAFYSYAHVPWVKPGQRRYTEAELPKGEEKRALYELGRDMFDTAGYKEVGMDHFALPEDALYQSMVQGTLHRNFMGYTTEKSKIMIGLGVSSISDFGGCYVQNVKVVEEYKVRVVQGQFPYLRGHVHNNQDQVIRQHILNLMCRNKTSWARPEMNFPELPQVLERLEEMVADKLVKITDSTIEITSKGHPFVRNACMAFDLRLWQNQPQTQLFSMVV